MMEQQIAIVGIGCRLPGGVSDTDSYWSLLRERRSGIREVPADRWDWKKFHHTDSTVPGKIVSRWGGFVDDYNVFDNTLFGISPREAHYMDVQQRWLMETSWQALEDAGIAPAALAGGQVGVFVGISTNETADRLHGDSSLIDIHSGLGGALAIAANRISFTYDLKGPSLAVDTACSSALVATALAVRSIHNGECDMALVGAANALVSPKISMTFSRASMLSPDGRCFTFDARANGYVRGEGAGFVVLKPLDKATADGDRIYAVIGGAAVNQDGQSSSLTVPLAESQEAMLREAYRQAGVDPHEVSYVEAHGTGTPVGDPIEAHALGQVVGRNNGAPPTLIGSVKTNIGHLEPASGIAGLIKAALIMHHGVIPPQLNFETPSPFIPFDELGLHVVTDETPLPGDRPVLGVNSFGFGGTNAHIVLTAPPAPSPTTSDQHKAQRPLVLPVAARDDDSLRHKVDAYHTLLHRSDNTAALAAAAGKRQAHLGQRMTAIGYDAPSLRASLRAYMNGTPTAPAGQPAADIMPPVFVFTGQGPQWWGMGQQLLEREPLVRDTVETVDSLFMALSGWSLLEEMTRPEAESRIDETDVAQPAIFALQVALFELWRSWGVKPAAVVGHSVGEVAAAYAAGIYTLADAVTIITHRSRLQHTTQGQGTMGAVGLSLGEALHWLKGYDVQIAAVNSPSLVTIAGEHAPIEAALTMLAEEGVFVKALPIDYAFHTAQMDPIRDELLTALADIQPLEGNIPFVSTVTATPRTGMGATYWWENVRKPVSFSAALAHLTREGHTTYLEIGPHPSLASALRECTDGHIFHSLRRGEDESDEMVRNAASLYTAGRPLDWEAITQTKAIHLPLPPTRFEGQPYGMMGESFQQFSFTPQAHPLLGTRINAPTPTWEVDLDARVVQSLTDHRIWESIVMPAAAFAEMGLAVARATSPHEHMVVEDLHVHQAMFIPEDQPLRTRTVYEDGTFKVYSYNGEWQLHAEGLLRPLSLPEPATLDVETVKATLDKKTDATTFYERLLAHGYGFGPSFQLVRCIWSSEKETLSEVQASPLVEEEGEESAFHHALLDSCLQSIGVAETNEIRDGRITWLPASIKRVELFTERIPSHFWVHTFVIAETDTIIELDTTVYGMDGIQVARVMGIRFERMQQADMLPDDLNDVYHFEWQPKRLASAPLPPLPQADIFTLCEQAAPKVAATYHLNALNALSRGPVPEYIAQSVVNAWLALGWQPGAGTSFTFEEVVDRLGVIERHTNMLRQHIDHLLKSGYLVASAPGVWRISGEWSTVDPGWDEAVHKNPDTLKISKSLKAISHNLADIYRGRVDPLHVLFPDGSLDILHGFYTAPHATALYETLVEGLKPLCSPERPLRILEIGAGTGAMTETVIAGLGDRTFEYTFTDLSAHFFKEARQRLPQGITYTTFDITRHPAEQSIPLHSYDIVLAGNVLHTVPDIPAALENISLCLAADGKLGVLELRPPHMIGGFIFGVLTEWWKGTEQAIQPKEVWQALLAEAGFVSHVVQNSDVALLLAQKEADAPLMQQPRPRTLLLSNTAQLNEVFDSYLTITHMPTEADLLAHFEEALPEQIVVDWQANDPMEAATVAFRLGRALTTYNPAESPRVAFVTWGAQAVRPEDTLPDLVGSTLAGFVRVINNEHPTYRWQLFDFNTTDDLHNLAYELSSPPDELEIAYREGQRYVNRLCRTPLDKLPQTRVKPGERPYQLEITQPGRISNLQLNLTGLPPLHAHEVEVNVKAVGLNFRDLMKVLGIYPGKSDDLRWLGDDIAGEIVAVGDAVEHLQPGDRVFGFAPYGLRSRLRVNARSVQHLPPALSYEEAATIPTVFNTAHYALVTLARLQPGERVLIHSATGGVGQAAVQIAQARGLHIIGTAGTPEKRILLREQGVEHVFHSRTLNFADDVMRVTDGRGVDAVLNALAGDFIPKNLSVLAPFGRFLEIGKVDIFNNSSLGMRALRNNISFHVIDLAQMLTEQPERAETLFKEVCDHFDQGDYTAIPLTTFPITQAEEAFRYMAAAKHIGKVVISFEENEVEVGLDSGSPQRFNSTGEYLVVGGVRGFGLVLVEWLAAHGARHFTLMSRSGVQEEEAARTIEALRTMGVNITIAQGDVTIMADVQRVVEGIKRPLVGVVHSALLLRDGLLVAQDDEDRWLEALRVKAVGGLNLHQATLGHPLEMFLSLSSSSSIYGGMSQSNYAAGNALLDALAHHRRAQGLPALTVNFGALSGAGHLARHADNAAFLEAIGIHTIHVQHALKALGYLMQADLAQGGIVSANWSKLVNGIPMLKGSPVYTGLVHQDESGSENDAIVERLLDARPQERPALLQTFITLSISEVLESPIDSVEMTTPIASLGLDSLMSVELVNMVNRQLNKVDKSLAVSEVLSAVTIGDLVDVLLTKFKEEDDLGSEAITSGLLAVPSQTVGDVTLDLHAEAQLGPAIRAEAPLAEGFSHVLLTGATGFLGAYLLRDLLIHTEADISCVVRAATDEAAFTRVRENLEQYGVWDEAFSERLHAYPGDISQPQMSLAAYEALVEEADTVLHNASWVNLVQPYHVLKSINVGGVEEILRFATQGRLKPVHLVSTTGVFYRGPGEESNPITESEWPDPARLPNGYRQSKWVAEQLVRQAMERGIPATIYRPGFITGDSVTGASNPDDLLNRIVTGTVQLGARSDIDSVWNMTPVDYISRAIIYLCQQPEAIGRVFHVTQQHNTSLSDMLRLGLMDDDLQTLPYADWRSALLQQQQHRIDNALHPLMPMFGDVPTEEVAPQVDRTNTVTLLAGTGITCPPVDEALIHTYTQYLLGKK